MKQKSIYILFVTAGLFMLNACSDSENSPKEKYSFGEYSGSLAKANLYLAEGDITENWDAGQVKYRTYVITDGEYNGGSYWFIDGYTNATYLIPVQLYFTSPAIVEGEYPTTGGAEFADRFSYMNGYFIPNTESERFQSDATSTGIIKVSGGFESDDKLTIELSGQVMLWKNQDGWGRFAEKEEAERVAWSSPGVLTVDNKIEIDTEVFV